MKCPKCKVELEKGIAIDPQDNYSSCWGNKISTTYRNMEIIEVMKCPKCGYSNDMKDGLEIVR